MNEDNCVSGEGVAKPQSAAALVQFVFQQDMVSDAESDFANTRSCKNTFIPSLDRHFQSDALHLFTQ